ncbi:MAG: S41 family peptidase [Phycisphaerales bacterium]|nr:S41 family peptidase [Phycisphaerales bacterium]
MHIPFARTLISPRSVVVLALFLTGCTWRGPSIPRYRPPAVSANSEVSEWSDAIWHTARDGRQSETMDLMLDPPPGAPGNVPLLAERALVLQEESARDRVVIAETRLQALGETDVEKPAEYIAGLEELADLHVAGLPDATLAEKVGIAIGKAIPRAIAAAEEAEAELAWPEAERQWAVVETLTTAIGDVELMKKAQKQLRRVGLFRAWAEKQGDPPSNKSVSYYLTIFERLVELHVDSPDWRDLALAGMALMELRSDQRLWSGSADAAAHDRATVQRLQDIRLEFETASAETPCEPGQLCFKARQLLRRTLQRVRDAVPGESGNDFNALARAFVMGAALETDMRTQMVWPENTDTLRRALGNTYVGIGAYVGPSTQGLPRVRPLAGSPARKAGVKNDDLVLEVDGISTRDRTLNSVVEQVLGLPGTPVVLTLERDGVDEPITVTVIRETINQPAVAGWRQKGIDANGQPTWNWLIEPDFGIAYVRLNTFNENTEIGFRTALHDAARVLGPGRQVEGLVLDLRDNTGGSKFAATRLVDLFLEHGKVFSAKVSGGEVAVERAGSSVTRLAGMPTVVLVNELSASASELLAGFLQGQGNAVVIGERSFGKGSVQALLPIMSNGGILVITMSWYEVPNLDLDLRSSQFIETFPHLYIPTYRMVDRTMMPDNWGVDPQIFVGLTNSQRDASAGERSEWHTYQGLDVPDADARDGSDSGILDSNDQPLLLAMALLEARISGHAHWTPSDN